MAVYSRKAVQKEIDKANASGKVKFSKSQQELIHALLKGRQKSDEPDEESK